MQLAWVTRHEHIEVWWGHRTWKVLQHFSPVCAKTNEGDCNGNAVIYYLICEAKPLQPYRGDELLCDVIVTVRGHHAPKARAEGLVLFWRPWSFVYRSPSLLFILIFYIWGQDTPGQCNFAVLSKEELCEEHQRWESLYKVLLYQIVPPPANVPISFKRFPWVYKQWVINCFPVSKNTRLFQTSQKCHCQENKKTVTQFWCITPMTPSGVQRCPPQNCWFFPKWDSESGCAHVIQHTFGKGEWHALKRLHTT